MKHPLDAYDVAAIAEKVGREERAARQRHIDDVARDLRAEFRREVIELREEVGELLAEVHKALQTDSDDRAALLNAIGRVQVARTRAGL